MTTELSADENFELETNIENVGFGNLFKNEQTSVIIKGNGFEKEFSLWNLDADKVEKASNYAAQNWKSGTSLTDRKSNIMSAELDPPDDMPTGNYKVYIKIANRKDGEGEYPYASRMRAAMYMILRLKQTSRAASRLIPPLKMIRSHTPQISKPHTANSTIR